MSATQQAIEKLLEREQRRRRTSEQEREYQDLETAYKDALSRLELVEEYLLRCQSLIAGHRKLPV